MSNAKHIKCLESCGWATKGRIYLVHTKGVGDGFFFTDIISGAQIECKTGIPFAFRDVSETQLIIYKIANFLKNRL